MKKSLRFNLAITLLVVACFGLGVGIYLLASPEAPVPVLAQTEQSHSPREEFSLSEPSSAETTLQADGVSHATLVSCGDVMCEYPLVEAHYDSQTGSFDFDPCFAHVKHILSAGDITAGNLECVLSGYTSPVNQKNQFGFVRLHAPDDFVHSAKNSGFTLLTTANNHLNDGGAHGIRRTLEQLDGMGLQHTGTRLRHTDDPYVIQSVNGITFGFLAYTYQSVGNPTVTVNGNPIDDEFAYLVNVFTEPNPGEGFYSDVGESIAEMRTKGAEVIVVYIHWGKELTNEKTQRQHAIAQRMCNLGVDLLVGCHPHVVQGMAVYSDPETGHNMPCAYSLGSIISSMDRHNAELHCEDGVILTTRFTKHPDGTVAMTQIQAQPVWFNRYETEGKTRYSAVPVSENNSPTDFSLPLSPNGKAEADASYKRTMAIIGEGMEECGAKLRREQ